MTLAVTRPHTELSITGARRRSDPLLPPSPPLLDATAAPDMPPTWCKNLSLVCVSVCDGGWAVPRQIKERGEVANGTGGELQWGRGLRERGRSVRFRDLECETALSGEKQPSPAWTIVCCSSARRSSSAVQIPGKYREKQEITCWIVSQTKIWTNCVNDVKKFNSFRNFHSYYFLR